MGLDCFTSHAITNICIRLAPKCDSVSKSEWERGKSALSVNTKVQRDRVKSLMSPKKCFVYSEADKEDSVNGQLLSRNWEMPVPVRNVVPDRSINEFLELVIYLSSLIPLMLN